MGTLYLGSQKVLPALLKTTATISSLTVSPSTTSQTITASGGTDGYSPITVNAVTYSIDPNIVASNIKSGVSILGVSGSVVELVGETRSVSINDKNGNTFTPNYGKNGITSITVTPTNQAKTITPTTSSQSITVPSGYSGFGTLTVDAVTASIDANITAGNIKDGVTILGVTGTMQGPETRFGTGIDDYIGVIDSNGVLQYPEGTINGITFTGVEDIANKGLYFAFTYKTNISGTVSFPDLTQLTSSQSCSNAFSYCDYITSADLSSLTTVSGSTACSYMFAYCTRLTSFDLSSLTTIGNNSNNNQSCGYMFSGCSNLTSADLSSLTTIGFYGCNGMFSGCSNLTSVDLSSLTNLNNSNCCSFMFNGCSKLSSISFPALTTTSFGSTYTNQFNSMFNSSTASTSGGCTVHFPSNLQSTISGLTGYPTFGGSSSLITIAFDLSSTS